MNTEPGVNNPNSWRRRIVAASVAGMLMVSAACAGNKSPYGMGPSPSTTTTASTLGPPIIGNEGSLAAQGTEPCADGTRTGGQDQQDCLTELAEFYIHSANDDEYAKLAPRITKYQDKVDLQAAVKAEVIIGIGLDLPTIYPAWAGFLTNPADIQDVQVQAAEKAVTDIAEDDFAKGIAWHKDLVGAPDYQAQVDDALVAGANAYAAQGDSGPTKAVKEILPSRFQEELTIPGAAAA